MIIFSGQRCGRITTWMSRNKYSASLNEFKGKPLFLIKLQSSKCPIFLRNSMHANPPIFPKASLLEVAFQINQISCAESFSVGWFCLAFALFCRIFVLLRVRIWFMKFFSKKSCFFLNDGCPNYVGGTNRKQLKMCQLRTFTSFVLLGI